MKKILFSLLLITFFSCSKTSTSNSPFAGHWTGTYTGADDKGTFDITIDNTGKAQGTATSVVIMETFQISGSVTSTGSIALTFGTSTSGGTFSGSLKNNTGSGTWNNNTINPPISGSWSGKKN